ncbi:cAMP-dependent protein kinase catalytic subunit, partial [Coemansia nantahalensis]
MAFINKILQKTKSKIGDRDRDRDRDAGSPTIDRVGPPALCLPVSSPGPPVLPLKSQPAPYATLQKHVVPSHAPVPLTLTGMATRAASLSIVPQGAPKGSISGLYPGAGAGVVPGQGAAPGLAPGLAPVPSHPLAPRLLAVPAQALAPSAVQGLPQNTGAPPMVPGQQLLQPQPLQAAPEPVAEPERSYEDTHVRLDDFEVFRTVGTGSFGRVRLVKQRSTGKHFAMKVLKKSHVVKAKQVEHVNSERRILAECDCPFIVNMLGTCQDRANLYMLMEYVVGGELFTYLRRYHRFPAPVAKFYAAEVLLALEYMHARNIIWRDTKPENILLDARGHVKLTDMGFAKKIVDRTWTLCGTPDYLAPEVIQAKGYGRSVDWWALGILIFEMIAGYPPFYDEDHYRLYEKILAGRIQWPAQFDPVARDLVSRLLTADLSRRLGNL